MPDPKNLEKLREDTSGDYFFFCVNMLKAAVGATKWREKCCKEHLSAYCPRTLEAYAVLCYINCYDVWCERFIVENEVDGNEENTVNGATTRDNGEDSGSSNKRQRTASFIWTVRGARRNQGWNREGIMKYNELCEKLKEQKRHDKTGSLFEEELMERIKDDHVEKLTRETIVNDIPEAEDCLAELEG